MTAADSRFIRQRRRDDAEERFMTGVRILAALIMTAACSGVGYSAARSQTRRKRALAELGQAVDRLEINML